jgi:putative ABC transport system ATP-binding protein
MLFPTYKSSKNKLKVDNAMQTMENPTIELKNVWKTYKMDDVSVQALRGVNLKVQKGKFAAIVGPSGSGKSTLLHMIGILDTPTSGKIFIDGVDTSGLDDSSLARLRGRKIGFVFQFFYLYPTLTAKENVELPLMIIEQGKAAREKRAMQLLRDVGLEKRANHLPSQLSGGERQRVAIARALANDPSFILADEPTGNLDSKAGKEIIELFINLNKEGRTVIIVTHDQAIASKAQMVIRIKDGKIQEN